MKLTLFFSLALVSVLSSTTFGMHPGTRNVSELLRYYVDLPEYCALSSTCHCMYSNSGLYLAYSSLDQGVSYYRNHFLRILRIDDELDDFVEDLQHLWRFLKATEIILTDSDLLNRTHVCKRSLKSFNVRFINESINFERLGLSDVTRGSFLLTKMTEEYTIQNLAASISESNLKELEIVIDDDFVLFDNLFSLFSAISQSKVTSLSITCESEMLSENILLPLFGDFSKRLFKFAFVRISYFHEDQERRTQVAGFVKSLVNLISEMENIKELKIKCPSLMEFEWHKLCNYFAENETLQKLTFDAECDVSTLLFPLVLKSVHIDTGNFYSERLNESIAYNKNGRATLESLMLDYSPDDYDEVDNRDEMFETGKFNMKLMPSYDTPLYFFDEYDKDSVLVSSSICEVESISKLNPEIQKLQICGSVLSEDLSVLSEYEKIKQLTFVLTNENDFEFNFVSSMKSVRTMRIIFKGIWNEHDLMYLKTSLAADLYDLHSLVHIHLNLSTENRQIWDSIHIDFLRKRDEMRWNSLFLPWTFDL